MKLDYLAIIKQAWDLLLKNVVVIALMLVVFFVLALLRGIGIGLVGGGIIGYVLGLVFLGVQIFLAVGAIRIMLDIVDGKSPKIDQLWSNGKYFKDGVIVVLAISGAMLLVDLLMVIGILLPLVGLVSLIVAIVTIYVALRLWFAMYYVVDKGMDGVSAIKASWEKTKGSVLVLFVLMLLLILLNFVGVLALIVGLLITIPLSFLSVTITYRKFQS